MYVLLIHNVVWSDSFGVKDVAIDELVWICTCVVFNSVTCIVSSKLIGMDSASILPSYVAHAPLNIHDSAMFCWVLSIDWYPKIRTNVEMAKTKVNPTIIRPFPILH